MRGRHVEPGSSRFVRDLVVMLLGIVVVGVLVFGGLWVLAQQGDDATPLAVPATTSTSTSLPAPTDPAVTATTAPATTTTTPTSTTIEVRDPSEVGVQVFNSVGIGGLAGQVTQQLSDAGYLTLPADNYSPPLEVSKVWYREGFGPEAFELAGFFPDADIEPVPDDVAVGSEADILVVLGASYSG